MTHLEQAENYLSASTLQKVRFDDVSIGEEFLVPEDFEKYKKCDYKWGVNSKTNRRVEFRSTGMVYVKQRSTKS